MNSDKPFSLAVVGVGDWGKNHVRAAHELFGPGLRYAVDSDESRREVVSSISPDIPFSTDIRDVLSDDTIEAMVIASPAVYHYELAKLALQAGKHILVEKPLALHADKATELTNLAEKGSRTLMVGHILLFHPAVEKIREILKSGQLGRLEYLYSNRLNLGKVRKEENILWSFAPHDIAIFDYLIGSSPISVHASGAAYLQPAIHDVTVTSLSYPNNIHGHIHVSWLHPFKEHRMVFIGDKAMLVFEDNPDGPSLLLYNKGIDFVRGVPTKWQDETTPVEFDKAEPLKQELLHFRDCIRKGTPPLADGRHATRVLQVLEKAQASLLVHQTGREWGSVSPYTGGAYVHETATIDQGSEIGDGTKVWHYSHVCPGARIGRNCSLGQNVFVANNVRIGDHCKIQNNVSIYEGVELEDYVFCGPSMVFTNITVPRCEFPQRGSQYYVKTKVEQGVSIGANATIVCGVTLKRHSFVGAGAVVTEDVPEFALVVGNPAKVVGWMSRDGKRCKSQEEAH
ncbi:MAG: Gfo/Idh/MocA family oxidoreductase, partial [Bdellovibrionales bacterium]|nr:Gfo/Idh/MocA family oxidoreductase [Bdellovibrionales bacterium]